MEPHFISDLHTLLTPIVDESNILYYILSYLILIAANWLLTKNQI